MRKLNFLKSSLTLFFVLQIIGVLFSLIFAIIFLIEDGNLDIPIKINGIVTTVIDLNAKIALIFVCFGYGAFIFGIYLFKQILDLFAQRIIFDDRIINNLNKIGKCFLAATLLIDIPSFILQIISKKRDYSFDFASGGFNSFLFTIGLSLFFMVLSEVFKIAKNIKEENELTI